jgi:hypothetical protein
VDGCEGYVVLYQIRAAARHAEQDFGNVIQYHYPATIIRI